MDVHRVAEDVLYARLGEIVDYDDVREALEWNNEDPSDANVDAVVNYFNAHVGLR